MNKEYCYLPQSIDRKISEVASTQLYAAGWTPEFVSSLRGAYDAAHGYSVEGTENTNPMWSWDINTEDYDGDSEQANNFWNIVETLLKFRNSKKKEQQDDCVCPDARSWCCGICIMEFLLWRGGRRVLPSYACDSGILSGCYPSRRAG